MKLHDVQFEQALRARIVQKIHQNRRSHQKILPTPAKRPWYDYLILFVVWLQILGLLAGFIDKLHSMSFPPATLLATSALWFFLYAFWIRWRITRRLESPEQMLPLLSFPFSNRQIAQFIWQKEMRAVWGPMLHALVILVLFVNIYGTNPQDWFLVPILALFLALAAYGLAFFFLFFPFQILVKFLAGFIILFLVTIFIGRWDYFLWFHKLLIFISPGGWVPGFYLALVQKQVVGAMVYWILTLLAVVHVFWWAPRLLEQHNWEELIPNLLQSISPPYEDRTPAEEEMMKEEISCADSLEKPVISESLDAESLSRPILWPEGTGWMERLVLRWLTPREQTILEMATYQQPAWTVRFKRAIWIFIVGIAISWLLSFLAKAQGLVVWCAIGTLLLAGLIALPYGGFFDRYYSQASVRDLQIFFGALYPVRPREIVILALKSGVVRGLPCLPVFALAGASLAPLLEVSPLWMALVGVKMVIFSFFLMPFLHTWWHSGGTNDTQKGGLVGFLVYFLLLGGLIGILLTGLGSLFAPLPWDWVCLFGTGLISWGIAFGYEQLYVRLFFDLIRPRS